MLYPLWNELGAPYLKFSGNAETHTTTHTLPIAYKKMLQRNLPEEVKATRKSAYKKWKKRVRELIENKRRVDEEFGRKLSQNFSENKKLFCKEVKQVRGGERSGDVRMRGEDGELVGGESKLKGIWKGYFEKLMNNEAEGEAVVTSMGTVASRGRVSMQREIDRSEIWKAIAKLKCGKVTGMDGITAEMMKYEGDAVVEWMLLMCERKWKKGEVPDDWKKAIIVPLYKGKGSRSECSNYRGISLLSIPGKVYGRIFTERLMEATEGKVSEEQGGFCFAQWQYRNQ